MIHILTGSNRFLLRQELHKLVSRFIADHGDVALERLDGEEVSFEAIQQSLQSLPFLSDKKMVVLESPGANKQFTEHATDLLKDLPDSTDLIIVESKLDKRLGYYKMLKKQTGFTELNELDENGLARWLMNLAKEKSATISSNDARYLVSRIGPNQQRLANELEKLAIHDPSITRQSIDLMTEANPQSTIFQLLEAAFAGNHRRAQELYHEQRVLKVEPQQIIAMIVWQLHILALVKSSGDRTSDEIARQAKINPYVVSKSANIARHLSLATLKQLIAELVKIDRRLKSESLNPDDVLLHYLLKIAE